MHGFFERWIADAALLAHVASFWERRDAPNLLFVHDNDLKSDLAGEMRRIAEFLGIRVPEDMWPAAVERCSFASMRARGDEIGTFVLFQGCPRTRPRGSSEAAARTDEALRRARKVRPSRGACRRSLDLRLPVVGEYGPNARNIPWRRKHALSDCDTSAVDRADVHRRRAVGNRPRQD